MKNIKFICDNRRHLICYPYSIENLHLTAKKLKIKRHWFHKNNNGFFHYDIPKRRIEEITNKCEVVSSREILKIIIESEDYMKHVGIKIAYLLRHNPEDLKMDKEGWVSVEDLLNKVNITFSQLENIVETNDKKRFAFNDDKTKIRASQGHSKKLGLDIKFDEVKFPITYYHGTAAENVKSIMKEGLHSQTRDYVHLSKDVDTAIKVGLRHSKNIKILEVDASKMKFDGYKIYESKNGVILIKEIPAKYLTIKN